MHKFLLATALAAILGTAAVPAHADDKSMWGTGVGAALGGLLGSQFGHGSGKLVTTSLGVFMGGLAGNSIGGSLDRADASYYGYGHRRGRNVAYFEQAYYQPTYVAPPAIHPRQVVYVQPQVVEYRAPAPAYIQSSYVAGEQYCREYTQKVRIGDRIEESYGNACLQPDGSWQIRPN